MMYEGVQKTEESGNFASNRTTYALNAKRIYYDKSSRHDVRQLFINIFPSLDFEFGEASTLWLVANPLI